MASWDKVFWRATAERCVGTLAASLMAVFSVEAVENIANTDWVHAGWVAGAATAFTFLKCVVANVSGGNPGPGFGNAETLEEHK